MEASPGLEGSLKTINPASSSKVIDAPARQMEVGPLIVALFIISISATSVTCKFCSKPDSFTMPAPIIFSGLMAASVIV